MGFDFDEKDSVNEQFSRPMPVIIVDEPPLPEGVKLISYQLTEEQWQKIKEINDSQQAVFVAARKTEGASSPQSFYETGVAGTVARVFRSEDNRRVYFALDGATRAQATAVSKESGAAGDVQVMVRPLEMDMSDESQATNVQAKVALEKYSIIKKKAHLLAHGGAIPIEGFSAPAPDFENSPLSLIAYALTVDVPKLYKPDMALLQKVIEQNDLPGLFDALLDMMKDMEQRIDLEIKIRQEAQAESSKKLDTHYLILQREQIDKKLKELGYKDSGTDEDEEDEIKAIEDKIAAADMPEAARKQASKKLAKLKRSVSPMGPGAEYGPLYEQLELMAEMPWNKRAELDINIGQVRKVLNEGHSGLGKVKDKIVEWLAVKKRNPQAKAPILCLVGPPGVGKTSLAQAVAEAINTELVSRSLGGVRDEAELRGHRPTYVGAMPGRIVQGIREAGVKNPVMVLDEGDKLGNDYKGDPSAALLEILDPEQNKDFKDHYLGTGFDLSEVIFIVTANDAGGIPGPVRDRMDILELPGYTESQKVEIAMKHLVPKRMKEASLSPEEFSISEGALYGLVRHYVHEAGVRNLERAIGSLCAKTSVRIDEGKAQAVHVTPDNLEDFLGPHKIDITELRPHPVVGVVVNGLAWTAAGGDVLPAEAVKMRGKGDLTVTGNVKDVMKESVRVGLSLVRARADMLGIDPKDFEKHDLHVHFPEGAIPKDGPSAGSVITTAIASLYSGRRVRRDLAMTGEINLSGEVMKIGGVTEKFQAAARSGIKTVLIPKANLKDALEVEKEIRDKLEIIPVETIDDVLRHAFANGAEFVEEKKLSLNVLPLPVARPGMVGARLNLMAKNTLN